VCACARARARARVILKKNFNMRTKIGEDLTIVKTMAHKKLKQ